jgi:hypothetical protein
MELNWAHLAGSPSDEQARIAFTRSRANQLEFFFCRRLTEQSFENDITRVTRQDFGGSSLLSRGRLFNGSAASGRVEAYRSRSIPHSSRSRICPRPSRNTGSDMANRSYTRGYGPFGGFNNSLESSNLHSSARRLMSHWFPPNAACIVPPPAHCAS